MKINEIVTTIHGELPNIGQPCIIVRFSGCNLNCFYCDTDHSPKIELTPQDLFNKVEEIGLRNILITGGEPLLHYNEVMEFLRLLYENGGTLWNVVLETNGTLPLNDLPHTYGVITKIAMDIKPLPIITPEQLAISVDNSYSLVKQDLVKFIFWDEASFAFCLEVAQQLSVTSMVAFSPIWEMINQTSFFSLNSYVKRIIESQVENSDLKYAFQLQLHKLLGMK